MSFSEWIPVLISKKKNALILESTFRETTTKGLKVLMKRFFFSRLHRVYACGSPHEKLARMFGFKGEVEKWYSVGLINQVAQPVYKPRQEVKKFLFIGRLIWQKNLSWLIDRFNDHPELSLDIIGYGKDFSLDNTIRYIWLFSLVSVLGGLYCFVSGKLSFLSGLLDFNEEGDTIYDGLTMGSVCIMQIICSFYFISKDDNSLLERYLMFLLIILDFVMTLMAFKRTPLLIALVIIFYYLRRLGYLALTPRKVICFILVFLAIMVYVISNSELSEAVATISENTFEGISSLVTGDHTGHSLTNSTDVRIENRDAAFGMIAHFDVLEYMIGRGFMTFWFDMPLVQSYLDMGVIGLVLFAFYTVYLPLYSVFSKIRKNRIVLLCGMFAFPGAVCCLTNGHPYFQSLWMPVSLLCFVLDEDWKIQGKKE